MEIGLARGVNAESYFIRQRDTILDFDSVLSGYESARCQLSPDYTRTGATFNVQLTGKCFNREPMLF